MIDITPKAPTEREAVVEARVYLKPEVIAAINERKVPKGDVLEAARLAGILAAKKTPELIPLCHPIAIEHVAVDFSVNADHILVRATVKAEAKTGMEMEALTAATIASLTIYDMCKPLDKDITVTDIRLVRKSGGKSGLYVRPE